MPGASHRRTTSSGGLEEGEPTSTTSPWCARSITGSCTSTAGNPTRDADGELTWVRPHGTEGVTGRAGRGLTSALGLLRRGPTRAAEWEDERHASRRLAGRRPVRTVRGTVEQSRRPCSWIRSRAAGRTLAGRRLWHGRPVRHDPGRCRPARSTARSSPRVRRVRRVASRDPRLDSRSSSSPRRPQGVADAVVSGLVINFIADHRRRRRRSSCGPRRPGAHRRRLRLGLRRRDGDDPLLLGRSEGIDPRRATWTRASVSQTPRAERPRGRIRRRGTATCVTDRNRHPHRRDFDDYW